MILEFTYIDVGPISSAVVDIIPVIAIDVVGHGVKVLGFIPSPMLTENVRRVLFLPRGD